MRPNAPLLYSLKRTECAVSFPRGEAWKRLGVRQLRSGDGDILIGSQSHSYKDLHGEICKSHHSESVQRVLRA